MYTTDPRNELFDLVDDQDRVIGTVKRREANRNPKLIHRAVAILVYNPKGQLFLQKRSRTKDTYPGHWTVSASGHVPSGKTYRQAAAKELSEELGIKKVPPLKLLGKKLIRYPNETEFETFFKAVYAGQVSLNKEEIEEGRWFTLNRRFFQATLNTLKISPELDYIIKNIRLGK